MDRTLKPIPSPKPLVLVGLAAAVAAGVFLRFFRVTRLGVEGCDTFLYLWIGKMWHEGKYVLSDSDFLYIRPVFYALSGIAMDLLGVNDYAIKILNCSLDVLTGGLLYLISRRALANGGLALLPVALYALLPQALLQARMENPHVPSTFFLMLGLYAYLRRSELIAGATVLRSLWLAVCALSASAASLIHGDLALLGPLFVGLLFFENHQRGRPLWGKGAGAWFLPIAAYTFLFFLPYLVCSRYYGPAFFKGLLGEMGEVYGHFDIKYSRYKGILPLIFWKNFEVIEFLASGSARWAFIGSLFLAWRSWRKGGRWPLAVNAPAFLAVGFVFLVTLFVKVYLFDSTMSRLYFAFMPLVFLCTIAFTYDWLLRVTPRHALNLVLLLGGWLAVHQLVKNRSVVQGVLNQEQSYIRATHDFLRNRIDGNHKLLITPYISYLQRRGFRSFIYFGENAVYVDTCVKTKMDVFLAANHIRYVVFTPKRTHDWRELPSYHNGDCYGLPSQGYSAEKELEQLESFVSKRSGKLILENEAVGRIYELPPIPKTEGQAGGKG